MHKTHDTALQWDPKRYQDRLPQYKLGTTTRQKWVASRIVPTQSPLHPWASHNSPQAYRLLQGEEEEREGRDKMTERMNKNLRELDVFKNGEIVYIQDENGKWTIRATVLNRRKHQGIKSASYMLRKTKTK